MPRIELAEKYVDTLIREADLRVGERRPTTVYLGGGTPSALPEHLLKRIFSRFDGEGSAEYTIEVNPEDVTPAFADFLAVSPVNRVSMGVQSLVDAELAICGRRHTADDAVEAFRRLRNAGISNISLDLIYGLPGQTLESWRHSLGGVMHLEPEHLSAYMLTYEPRTRFSAMRASGKIREADEDLIVDMYDELIATTRNAGFEHYEISNFARGGCRSIHNSSYWNGTEYVGLGTGAHSFAEGVRSYNPPDIGSYLRSWGEKFNISEEETGENRFNDLLITRLRTADGLMLSDLPPERFATLMKAAAPHIAARRITVEGGVMKINEDAWLVSDDILVDLIV